jgi:hypothetical protein
MKRVIAVWTISLVPLWSTLASARSPAPSNAQAPSAPVAGTTPLGFGKRDIAIPAEQLKIQNKQLVLPGATKDALKALPPFEYQKR